MELEDMKNEFPQTPESIKHLIESEVKKQLKNEPIAYRKPARKFSKRKLAVIVLAATMALGTTAFAAVRYYQMKYEKIGTYGGETSIVPIEEKASVESIAGGAEASENMGIKADRIEVPDVTLEVTYIPKGMIACEKQNYCYSETPYDGGISFVFYAMDMGDDAFRVMDTEIVQEEEILVGNHEGIYLEFASFEETSVKKIYVFYPEVHYVMEMFVGEDVSKEEAVKFASGVTLIPATEEDEDIVSGFSWSEYIEMLEDDIEYNELNEDFISISKEQMRYTHSIGEEFAVNGSVSCVENGLTAKVSAVELYDNISVLDPVYIEDDLYQLNVVDAEGNLLPAKKEYYKYGNGIDTLDEVVKTEEVPQKLVYVTVEYTNHGEKELTDILFDGNLLKLVESGNELKIWEWQTGDDWDYIVINGGQFMDQGMYYYDAHGGERNNNYISSIKPGETAVVHMGFIVIEEELPLMYLNPYSFGGCLEFSEQALERGYVDIRQ